MIRRGALIAVAALAGCGAPPDPDAAGSTRYRVDAAVAVAEPELRAVSAPGELGALQTVRIAARVAGVVERLLVQEGDRVEVGQVVAEIEPERFRIAVASAEAQVARARALRDDAAAQQRRRLAAAAAEPGLISDDELAQVQARTAQAEADAAVADAALARARLDLADARVTSPAAGIIQSRPGEPGMQAQVGTVLATVIDRSRVLLRCSVPVADAALLRPGQVAAFTMPGEAAARRAVVTLVGEAADRASRLVPVTAEVDAADAAAVRPGSFVSVTMELPPGPPRVLIPDLAVRPSSRGFLVYVIEGTGAAATARERRVVMGGRTRDARVAISDGIAAGERVVVRGAEALRDGAPLDLAESAAGR
jgi:membrane fusion protein, multidrug efflux system